MITARLKPLKLTDSLDPAKVRFVNEYYYLENLTVRLFQLAQSGEYQGQLAERFDFRNGKTELYVKIKEAYYSDGQRITANDVVNTFKRVILTGSPHSDPKDFIVGASSLNKVTDDIPGLVAISSDELVIKLSRPVKELFYYLQLNDYGILTPEQYKKMDLTLSDWLDVTSGPYRLEKVNEKFVLTANDRALNSHRLMPKKIVPQEVGTDKITDEIINGKIHFGRLTLTEFVDNYDQLINQTETSIFSRYTDGVVFLSLNIENPKFKDPNVRKWFYRKVVDNFQLEGPFGKATRKAVQYFLPEAKGHISTAEALTELGDPNLEEIPEQLKGGIKIRTVQGFKWYVPDNFEETLSKALGGVPVQVILDMDPSNYIDELGKRDFEVHGMVASMSYKVLGESLNLAYTSKNPIFLDPSGKIKQLLYDYQSTEDLDKESELISEILKTMVRDSECVPLYYYSGPKFINTKKLDAQDIYLQESFQYWRLKLRD